MADGLRIDSLPLRSLQVQCGDKRGSWFSAAEENVADGRNKAISPLRGQL